MGTTLTIRNLDETVKQKLRVQAATHGRAMEAEAREILTRAVTGTEIEIAATPRPVRSRTRSACTSVRGIWKDRLRTDEIMKLTREG